MASAIVSSKYQVVIPKEIRSRVGLKSGQTVQIIVRRGVITLVPDQSLSTLRGFLKGMRTDKVREKKDRS